MNNQNDKNSLTNHKVDDEGLIEKVRIINHFYYCMNVAVRMKKYAYPKINESQIKAFYREWLSRAQEKQIFDKIVLAEITWLKSEIRKYSADDFESRLYTVYCKSKVTDANNHH